MFECVKLNFITKYILYLIITYTKPYTIKPIIYDEHC